MFERRVIFKVRFRIRVRIRVSFLSRPIHCKHLSLIESTTARGYVAAYTRKNACSVTAFNSTDIRSVQDNVATPLTAMMVTVCISTDALSSVFISPDLSDTDSFHQCCWSIMPVTACSYRLQQSVPNIPVSFCYIRLIQH